MSVGEALPYSFLNSATVVGTRCIAAVFMTTNFTISSVAVSGVLFNTCRRFIASKPKGVAAFPKPRKFAVIFIAIYFFASVSLSFGKTSFKNGLSSLQSFSVRPLFSAISQRPFHKQITPVSFIPRFTASVPPSITDDDKLLIFPVATAQKNEKTIIMGKI